MLDVRTKEDGPSRVGQLVAGSEVLYLFSLVKRTKKPVRVDFFFLRCIGKPYDIETVIK